MFATPILGLWWAHGYNTIVDSFHSNKVGGYARVVVVNPLREKLSRFVLAICCT